MFDLLADLSEGQICVVSMAADCLGCGNDDDANEAYELQYLLEQICFFTLVKIMIEL